MSDRRRMLADLLKDDCHADDNHFEMHFAGARNGRIGGGVSETCHDDAAEASPGREAGRNAAAIGAIVSTTSLIGGLGWGAEMTTWPPVRFFIRRRERFFPCGILHGRQ